MKKFTTILLVILILAFSLMGCGGEPAEEAIEEPVVEEEVVEEPEMTYRLAAIYPGTITDADYNTLGHLGVTAVQDELGVEIAYSETVAVPDVPTTLRLT